MSRKAGSGHQNVRRLEDQAIAKADRQAKRNYFGSNTQKPNDKKRSGHTDTWKYRFVNGKWQLQTDENETREETGKAVLTGTVETGEVPDTKETKHIKDKGENK